MYHKFFKRVLDFVMSFVFLIILTPLIIIVVIVLFINNKGTPLFFQKRPGKNEKIFTLIKFKTMNDNVDKNGVLLSDIERLTKVGGFIRKTSFDELPQLINVLKGDMSFIGPRPLLVDYLPLYNEFQRGRHQVRPGITGWAQVNGRNSISWEQKFKLDLFYVKNISFRLDFRIFLLSIRKVFLSENINANECVTMNKFNGNN